MSINKRIAQELLEAVGGKDNVSSVAHCATRLRLIIMDEKKIDQERVEKIEKVKGAFFHAGQFQVIFGTGTVNQIYEEVEKFDINSTSKQEQAKEAAKKSSKFQRAIRTFGDVFVPIIPVLVATGLFMGVRGLVMQAEILAIFGLSPADISENFLLFTEILTDTAFIFLPALVAWSTFRVFGGTPIIGIVLGLMLVSPSLPNAWGVATGEDPLMFFGFIPVVGYQGSVLPAFIAGIIGAKLERMIRKRVPEALDLILTPFLTLLIMIVASLFMIGPIFHLIEGYILDGTLYILSFPFGLAGLFIGFFNQIIVITGVHHIFNLLEIKLLESTGSNPFNAIVTSSVAAQGGAALAVGLKTKSKKLKALAYPSTLSAFLGITEPAIFGINLRYVKPFIMGLIGGGAGGFVAALLGLKGTGMAVTVIPGTLLYLNGQVISYLFVNLVAIGVAFVLTWLFGFSDKQLKENG
ncbi:MULTISPECIES: sucrose-specific PTS transporter subunit IIBC [Clostridia]|uniref:sucrose-specific PTS transporter subunit IIBC n=1 Tax=Clostridia TaxID=186801 RepID=UPI000EA3FDF6|nr:MULTISPECIES: sucrose-specific PTS transporter subunit IIBC [Clostridia]NBJ68157.1 PTS sugar transporter subunit IIA [Roseburia sp. 1XD42-34]RKI81930.1 PTS sugar transporter subunit IIA [Clostridium sp. 1xD42-85]